MVPPITDPFPSGMVKRCACKFKLAEHSGARVIRDFDNVRDAPLESGAILTDESVRLPPCTPINEMPHVELLSSENATSLISKLPLINEYKAVVLPNGFASLVWGVDDEHEVIFDCVSSNTKAELSAECSPVSRVMVSVERIDNWERPVEIEGQAKSSHPQ